MSVSSPTAIFLLSLLGVPLTYIVNSVTVLHGPEGLLVSGVGALLLMVSLTYLVVARKGRPTDKLFYGKCQSDSSWHSIDHASYTSITSIFK